jgi:hypothetical protein
MSPHFRRESELLHRWVVEIRLIAQQALAPAPAMQTNAEQLQRAEAALGQILKIASREL